MRPPRVVDLERTATADQAHEAASLALVHAVNDVLTAMLEALLPHGHCATWVPSSPLRRSWPRVARHARSRNGYVPSGRQTILERQPVPGKPDAGRAQRLVSSG